MRTLLAFDKFKDALSAGDACAAAADALRTAHPDWELDVCPLTDGGDGFARILTQACQGEMRTARVTAPRGQSIDAAYGLVALNRIPPAARALLALPDTTPPDATVAIVEMAAASGLALVAPPQRDPWLTSTFGTGELIRHAAASGAAAVLLGVGGSATNDLGLGALAALGLEFHGGSGAPVVPPTPQIWERITGIGGEMPSGLPPIRIACDVTNPLLGARGCAAVYGPQKGLLEADLRRMEHASARLALMLTMYCRQPDTLMEAPGAGAAGGIAFGLMTAARASLLPGFGLVSAWLNLESRIAAADVVLTGEGRFDESSFHGKGPGAIVALAKKLGRPVHVFAGTVRVENASDALHAITPAGTPLTQALRAAPHFLRAAIRARFP
jgi:glycerate kinase